ncbi:hypothetical protein [Amantichitinum ursilacus]|uniref:Uncharacterized protein n=1 Tax=Amantichitinum ursilacus TaxID=857265 RepID=A0A0N0XG75_9NEIS|nr:hypothetical protein [Amantichitinum ursilacus]KPC49797.1 hypothetical protein WG78_19325 [Amantichitinum ursilacus]
MLFKPHRAKSFKASRTPVRRRLAAPAVQRQPLPALAWRKRAE